MGLRVPARSTALAIAAAGLLGCGGSSSSSANGSASPSTAAPAGGHIDVVLTAPGHSPRVNAAWPYSLRVSDSSGRPLAGVVDIQFTFAGQVVGHDVPPSHRFVGRWHDILRWPARSVGYPLAFEAVVHTAQGTQTIDYPVHVRP